MSGNYPFFTQDIDEFGNVRGFFPVSIGPNCYPDQDEIICRRVTQSAIHGYQLKNGNVVFASLSELREVVASDFKNIEDMPYATYEASLFLNDGPAKKQAVQKLSKLPKNILIYEDRTVVNRTKPLAVIPKVSGKEVDDWASQAEHLVHELGENNFKSWVEPLRFNGISDSVGRFEAPTSFMANYVAQNFSDIILSRLQRVDENIQRLEFRTTENFSPHPTQDNTTKSQSSAHGERTHEELPGASYDDRFNFDTFVVGKPNELAHAAARRVAEAGKVTFNPLFLYGGVGLGKTHLMHAIAWELTRQNPNSKVLYLSAEQFMYRFIQALRERRMMNFKEMLRSVDVLMVDDVQFIAGKDSTQEEFFHTFNALIDQNKQIVISADRVPDEIKGFESRISSRLQSGLIVDLHPTDYELRLGILQVKTEIYSTTYENIELRGGVLEFLAQRISTNVRVLEGALTRLFAFSSLANKPITVELAQDCLSDILRASERKISVVEIQRKVAEHYNIRLSDMIGPRKVKIFARPRQVAMFLSRTLTSRSLPEIGRFFGGRGEAVVRSNVKKVEALKATDGQIAEDLELLRRILEA